MRYGIQDSRYEMKYIPTKARRCPIAHHATRITHQES